MNLFTEQFKSEQVASHEPSPPGGTSYTSPILLDENWQTLASFFPTDWRQMGKQTGAITRLRHFKTADQLMRTLLLHVAKGYSLRETVAVAKSSGLVEVSDVALLKRLRCSEAWFHQLCFRLFQEGEPEMPTSAHGYQIRLVDGTVVSEPGKTGSRWKIHYSLRLPSLICDEFTLTPVLGEGNGESLRNFGVQPHDCLIADRAYSTVGGMAYVEQQAGQVIVRLNTGAGRLLTRKGRSFNLVKALRRLQTTDSVDQYGVIFQGADPNSQIQGRLCVVRKSEHAIAVALKKIRTEASKRGRTIKPETLEYAKYVLVFTTLPAETFSAQEVLQWYRLRWQIELPFKRLKSLAGLGHLPKHDEASSRAWLYAKLFVGLLTQKMARWAESVSPWGYRLGELRDPQQLA